MNRLHQINGEIIPDAKDAEILDKREAEWNARPGPRVGDFVQIGERFGRFSHEWHDGLQWSDCGSFYLSGSHASFSGGLNKTIPFENLELTDETRDGTFWFFHHGFSGAHRGVGATIPCRVFKAKTTIYTVNAEGNCFYFSAVDWSDAWNEGHRRLREVRKAKGLSHYDYYCKDINISPGRAD